MVMIVFHHYSVHGNLDYSEAGISFDRFILSVIQLGEWAVNIFVIIFAYFSVKSKFKPMRIIRLYAQVWFYSVLIFIAYTLWNRELHLGEAIMAMVPIVSSQYWFFSHYILLCFIMPFLNILTKNISRQMHLRLIWILFATWSVLPNVLPRCFEYVLGAGSTGAFVLLYFIGAYMRLYPDCSVNKKRMGYALIMFSLLIMAAVQFIRMVHPITFIHIDCFSNSAALSIGFAVGMLSIFRSITIKPNRFINGVAACVFGVYLIHDNNYIRPFLWQYLLKNCEYFQTGYLIPHMLISVFSVFVICVIIEFIRKQTIEKLWIRYCEPLIEHRWL